MQPLTFKQEDLLNDAFNKYASDKLAATNGATIQAKLYALQKANYDFVVAVTEIGKTLR